MKGYLFFQNCWYMKSYGVVAWGENLFKFMNNLLPSQSLKVLYVITNTTLTNKTKRVDGACLEHRASQRG